MEPVVAVALISSVSSLSVAAGTAVWTSRQNERNRKAQRSLSDKQGAAQKQVEVLKHRLEREAKEEDRRADERERLRTEMARHRLPLLEAASDLGHRIDNIRNGGFLHT